MRLEAWTGWAFAILACKIVRLRPVASVNLATSIKV